MVTTNTNDWFIDIDDSLWLLPEHLAVEAGNEIAEKFAVRSPMRVLDCPCGRGDVSLPLARRGAHVIGWDQNHRFIKQARGRFSHEGLSAEFHCGDMREVIVPGGCDFILNWYGSFGYFSDDDNRRLMVRFASCLNSGGLLITDNVNPLEKGRPAAFVKTLEDGSTQSINYDTATKRVTTGLRNPATGEDIYMSIRLYTLTELQELLEYAGLEFVAAYAQHFRPFCEGDKRIVCVARKP